MVRCVGAAELSAADNDVACYRKFLQAFAMIGKNLMYADQLGVPLGSGSIAHAGGHMSCTSRCSTSCITRYGWALMVGMSLGVCVQLVWFLHLVYIVVWHMCRISVVSCPT